MMQSTKQSSGSFDIQASIQAQANLQKNLDSSTILIE